MPHSLGQVYVHLVFSTKNRVPFLTDRALRDDLHGYMTGIFRNLGCPSLRIGGVEDHVHALFRLSRMQPIVRVVQEVQQASQIWAQSRGMADFAWQDGYGAFSVSPQRVHQVIRYIERQEERHREETFADEYRGILRQCSGLEHQVDVHLVFSTKNRIPLLDDEAVRRRLHHRLAEICETVDCQPLQIGGI